MSKKRFLIFGILNTLITNIILQILLLHTKISLATLLTQIISMFIGFFLYGKFVFRNNSLSIFKLCKYFYSTLFLWILNWSGINLLSKIGLGKNIAALLLIPFLAFFSYLIQKKKVFIE